MGLGWGLPSHSHQLVHVPSGQLGIGVSSMFRGTSLEMPEAGRDEAEIHSTTSTLLGTVLGARNKHISEQN